MALITAKTGTLSRTQSAHLLKRLTFGPTKEQIDTFTGLTTTEALALLFVIPSTYPDDIIDPATGNNLWLTQGATAANSVGGSRKKMVKMWWVNKMFEDNTALERMTFFYHVHFTTQSATVAKEELMYHQNQLFRMYAFGNFKTLVKKICRDGAMGKFLDNTSNTRTNPNENFARELLELYTIGKGPQISNDNYTTYTEDDVREIARTLTGFKTDSTYSTLDPDTGLQRMYIKESAHDSDDKILSSAFQNLVITGASDISGIESELDVLIERIFDQDATALNICRKLYRVFVYTDITPEIENDIIIPLASTFRSNNYEMLPVLEQLFSSQHFYNEDGSATDSIGALIKSPLDLVLGTTRFFKVSAAAVSPDLPEFIESWNDLTEHARVQGMEILEPTEVAGWPAYHQGPDYGRNWLSSNTLTLRFDFIGKFINGKEPDNGNMNMSLDVLAYVSDPVNISNPGDPNSLIDELITDLYPFGIDTAKRDLLKGNLLDAGDPDYYWTTAWINYTNTGDDNVVRVRVENLLKAMLESAEYQVL